MSIEYTQMRMELNMSLQKIQQDTEIQILHDFTYEASRIYKFIQSS